MDRQELGFIVVSKSTYYNGGRNNFKVHGTYEEALDEAERLCRLEKEEFYIYKPIALVEMVDVQVTEL